VPKKSIPVLQTFHVEVLNFAGQSVKAR